MNFPRITAFFGARPFEEDHQLISFDPRDPKYMCCCRTMSAKKGALAIGYFHVLLAVSGFVIGCIFATNMLLLSLTVPFSVILAFFSSLMIFGIHAETTQLLMPALLVQLLLIGGLSGLFVYTLVAMIAEAGHARTLTGSATSTSIGQAIMQVFLSAISFGFEIWFTLTILGAYRFFRDKRRARRLATDGDCNAQQRRLAAEYSLPPPPPAYTREAPQLLMPHHLMTHQCDHSQYLTNHATPPPTYEDACSSAATSLSSLSGNVEIVCDPDNDKRDEPTTQGVRSHTGAGDINSRGPNT